MLFFGQHFIHFGGAIESTAKNQVREVLLIFKGISLRKDAAIGMSHEAHLSQMQRLADTLHVLHHVFDRVLRGAFKFF